MASLLARLFPPSFLPERDIPDFSGKVALVTGGNTGIGYQTAREAIARLQEETGKAAVFIELDLADLRSVRKAAEAFLKVESRLDLLFNNGGVMITPPEQLTVQGYDLQFGTNVIGHFFLTELLLPALTRSHQITNVRARIINASSIGHQMAPGRGVELASLKGGPERDAWVRAAGGIMGPWRLYGASKLGNIIISNYFARVHDDVLVSCALHPGFIATDWGGAHGGTMMQITGNTFFYPVPLGATINGQYLVPWGAVGKADARAADRALEDEVIAYIRGAVEEFSAMRAE
ncbi:NAD-P-binding protein [Mycena polygramma]|nr:NAD-P-binding protein [Mycena polygramma]